MSAVVRGQSSPPGHGPHPTSAALNENGIENGNGSGNGNERRVISSDHSHLTTASLLRLPPEILSEIASLLSLIDALSLLSTCHTLLSLTQTSLTPLRPILRSLLLNPLPSLSSSSLSSSLYPTALCVLPHLTSFVPRNDAGALFIDVLVRARPKWILEKFECGRWSEQVWKEAFERRFLPSWKRYKREGDTWRAVFLRTLGKLEHRHSGCTHEESWTRFITLHRNGSASLSRMYSRTFDPYDIYDEIKHQNNNDAYPTHVRVILHLQDVRILALGVLADRSSFFVNPNAHLALHPPLLRGFRVGHRNNRKDMDKGQHDRSLEEVRTGAVPIPSRISSNMSGSSTGTLISINTPSQPFQQLHHPYTAPTEHGASPSLSSTLSSTISSWLPNRVRRLSSPSDTQGNGSLDIDSPPIDPRRRSWSLSRTRSGSLSRNTVQVDVPSNPNTRPVMGASSSSLGSSLSPRAQLAPSPLPPLLEDHGTFSHRNMNRSLTDTNINVSHSQPSNSTSPSWPQPYPVLVHPTPASCHRLYPNYTPALNNINKDHPPPSDSPAPLHRQPEDRTSLSTTGSQSAYRSDSRYMFEEIEDVGTDRRGLFDFDRYGYGHKNARSGELDEPGWGGGPEMAEWDEKSSQRMRWVGSMIIVAQLHPSDRNEARPAGSRLDSPIEGAGVDLGPKGMYTSIEWEDLDVLLPWIHLTNSGAYSNEPRRSGMGFE